MDSSKFKIQAQIARALANASRLMILDALKDGERCVCDLVDLVGSGQPTISRHLSVLREAGILEDRKEGNRIFYRLKSPDLLLFLTYAHNIVRQKISDLRRGDTLGEDSDKKSVNT